MLKRTGQWDHLTVDKLEKEFYDRDNDIKNKTITPPSRKKTTKHENKNKNFKP